MAQSDIREAPAPGQDPEKRRQILAGARDVFFQQGFDAASMGDIARAAGVSKGTLYVYFKDKADLFATLVSLECTETAEQLFVLDTGEQDLEAALTRLGVTFMQAMVRPCNVAILRTVIAIAGKFPDIGHRFLDAGPRAGIKRLAVFLQAQVDRGALAIDDVEVAASQFLLLCKDGVMTPILLGSAEVPDTAGIEAVVRRAVRFFLCAYRPGAPHSPCG